MKSHSLHTLPQKPTSFRHIHALKQCIIEPLLFSNYTTLLSKTVMTYVGFLDGAFQDYDTVTTNITDCRGNSIRFVRAVKLLSQARSKMGNDTNQIVF